MPALDQMFKAIDDAFSEEARRTRLLRRAMALILLDSGVSVDDSAACVQLFIRSGLNAQEINAHMDEVIKLVKANLPLLKMED